MPTFSPPGSPTDGDTYTFNSVTYEYEAATNKWKVSSTLNYMPVTGGTFTGNVTVDEVTETVHTLSGTSVALDPGNGTIQTHTLSGATTYSDSFSAGQSMLLMIDDGSAATVTWPTMTWVNNTAAAPTLATSGYTVVSLWKVGSTLYGALVGDGS